MSVSVVATTKGGSSLATSTSTVTRDASTLVGDLVTVALAIKGAATSVVAAPDGTWTLVGSTAYPSTGILYVYTKTAATSGASSYTFSFTAVGGAAASVVTEWIAHVTRGQSSVETLSAGISGITQSVVSPIATTSEASQYVVRFVGGYVGSGATDEKASTWEAAVASLGTAQGNGGTGTGMSWISGATEVGPVVAGTIPGRTLTLANVPAGWATYTIGVKAVATGTPTNSVAPAIATDGTPQTGETVICSSGTWTGNPNAFAYQWRRNGNVITGATSSPYVLQAVDEGLPLTCVVSATNGTGTATATSAAINPTSPAAVAPPVNTVAPTIVTDGSPAAEETVGVNPGSWSPTADTYAYQWRRNGNVITGATGVSYVLTLADIGTGTISCRVIGTNSGGSATVNTVSISVAEAPVLWRTLIVYRYTNGTWTNSTAPPPPPPPTTTQRTLGHAFWSQPLGITSTASTSVNMVYRLAYQATMGQGSSPVYSSYGPPGSTVTNGSNTPPPFSSSFALPIYVMDPSTPRVPVYASRIKTNLQVAFDAGVPLPDPAFIPGGTIPPSGSDGSVVIICGNEVWELWQLRAPVSTDPSGYSWICTQGGYIANRSTHPGIWSGPQSIPQGWGWGVAATGMSKLGGMLTADDFYESVITHPLGLSLPITGGDQTTADPDFVLPATRFDRMTFIPGGAAVQPAAEQLRVVEGARFRLPSGFDVDAYVAGLPVVTAGRTGANPTILRKVLTCIRDYGMIVTDSAGVVAFSAENPKTFGTPYSSYTTAQAPVWGNFGQQIPWSSLVQVAVPSTDISVRGAS